MYFIIFLLMFGFIFLLYFINFRYHKNNNPQYYEKLSQKYDYQFKIFLSGLLISVVLTILYFFENIFLNYIRELLLMAFFGIIVILKFLTSGFARASDDTIPLFDRDKHKERENKLKNYYSRE